MPFLRFPFSLRHRLMAFTGTIFLVLAILIVTSIMIFVYTTEQRNWRARQVEAARFAAKEVEAYIEKNESTLNWLDIYGFDEVQENPEALQDLLEDNAAFMEVILLDDRGNPIQDAARGQHSLANQFTVLQSEWFRSALNGEKSYSRVETSPQGESYIIFAMPSRQGGVIGAQIQMDELWDTVADIRFGENGIVYIVSQRGRVIAHPDRQVVLSNQTIQDTIQFQTIIQSNENEWYGTITNFNGVKVVSATSLVTSTGWIVVTELPRTEAFATTRLAMILLTSGILVLMSIAMLFYRNIMFNHFLQPVNLLRSGVEQLGNGNLSYRIEIPRMDELGKVMEVFNAMAGDLEKQQENLQKAVAYEYEARRSRELDILLQASEATSSSLDLNTVLLSLASQLLELSGFESCFISEWDRETDRVYSRLDHSKVFWRAEKRDAYSLADYPRSMSVLLTGVPIILQGDFEAEERQWMEELGRTAAIILPLKAKGEVIGLVEMATIRRNGTFDLRVLADCMDILAKADDSLTEPVSSNAPQVLFEIEGALLKASGADVCSFSEWDKPGNAVLTVAVSSEVIWEPGQGRRYAPSEDAAWRLALQEGKASVFVHTEGNPFEAVIHDGKDEMTPESWIVFPLQNRNENIGLVELYHFNRRISVPPDQITLLRTIADKASASIENAKLLQLTEKRLKEKESLLKEVHHRVKNNLQVISSLLSLQSIAIKDATTKDAFRESQARVRSMAAIHEKLYQSPDLEKINFGEYIQNLSNDLFQVYRPRLGDVRLEFALDEAYLSLDQAVPCGLILNELVTNTLKYAFPDKRRGTILIELCRQGGASLCLRVKDDGIGIPPALNIKAAGTLGLQLVNNLVEQMDGELVMYQDNGTVFQVTLQSQLPDKDL